MNKISSAIFLLIVFVLLALNYESVNKLDELGQSLFRGNELLKVFHFLGETEVVILITVAMLIWQLCLRNTRGVILVVIGVAGTFGINQLLKRIVERPRPEMVDQLETFSFPSAHAMMSMGYITILIYLVVKQLSSLIVSRVLMSLAGIVIICVGLSRVAQNHHYLTDILAGWSLAGAWILICILIYEKKATTINRMC